MLLNTFERAYTTKQVAKMLSIGHSTLRKWSGSLERNGYFFTKNEQGHRLFLDEDIKRLNQFKQLVQEVNLSLDNAAIMIIKKYDEEESTEGTAVVPLENAEAPNRSLPATRDQVEELLQKIEQQEKFNQKVVEMLEKQQEAINQQNHFINEKLEKSKDRLMELPYEIIQIQHNVALLISTSVIIMS